ncbi:LOW QUALITY PROTEIN: hypothetical protein RJ639_000258 [Escallonia herrerae]|uniref:Cytochrome P450 n=1 Tax=Escallonia herrerae TaxID=1293975 RepID=A0AA88XA88_9ASTE|nr:LOW QUALITY PROTEIN: hypothetical protein RJ639_000258 [Escallonia herrerae]
METWFIVIFTLCLALILKSLLSFFINSNKKLPPGPVAVPVIGSFLWLRKSLFGLDEVLHGLRLKYGPIVTLQLGPQPVIFICSRSLAHRALVQNGAVFSDRPKALGTAEILNSNQHNVNSAAYGPTWRLLRRNLASEILHPSCSASFSHVRLTVLNTLLSRLLLNKSTPVAVVDHIHNAMFALLVIMCFGDKLDDEQIKQNQNCSADVAFEPTQIQRAKLLAKARQDCVQKQELVKLRKDEEDVLIPLIRARIQARKRQDSMVAYVDTMTGLQLPDEGNRSLTEGEMVSLCEEFVNAGTDTTSNALQWIMANLVKYPKILVQGNQCILGPPPPPPVTSDMATAAAKEEDVEKMPYLKAVVLEGLRRHPPAHYVLPNMVTEKVELGGYVLPKGAQVNFMVAEMGWDPEVWEEPMSFTPERFLSGGQEGFDVTGSREIKMMPFGAGRRICPARNLARNLALLHLGYYVANLVWYFEWTAVDGDDIDLSEKLEFTVVMKHPLQAHATTLSTTEAEYMALTEAAKEALWLKGPVEELGFKQRGVLLQCDSQNAMDLAKNQESQPLLMFLHERTDDDTEALAEAKEKFKSSTVLQ